MSKVKAKTKKVSKRSLYNSFQVNVNISLTGEHFCISDIQPSAKVVDLKREIELVAGIPQHLQRLQYLDEGDLLDDSDLRSNFVVTNGTLILRIWRTWVKLVDYACKGDIEGVLSSGVDMGKLESLTIDPLLYQSKIQQVSDRATIALYIAAHRGHKNLINKLLDKGCDVNCKTQYGRSPLHAAAASGNANCLDLMLGRGASMEIMDKAGKSALSVANDFGNKDCERRLFLFQWQKRAIVHDHIKPDKQSRGQGGLMMHQQFDSGFPTWIKGSHAQVYLCTTLPPGEFVGSAINAPKSEHKKPSFQNDTGINAEQTILPKIDEAANLKRSPKSYQMWMKDKRRERQTAKELMDALKEKEENDKHWEKEQLKENRKLNRSVAFRAWGEEKSHKEKQRLATPLIDDKPRRKIELYEEYNSSPRFEHKFILQKLETLDFSLLKI